MKTYKKYQDIPQKYRFDLEPLLENKTVEENLQKIDLYTEKLVSLKDNQFDSVDKFIEYKNVYEEFLIFTNKLHNYIFNKLNTNLVDAMINKYSGEFSFKMSQLEAKLGSIENIFFKNIDKVLTWKDNPKVKNYKKEIDFLIESKKHKLSDEVEEYLTQTSFGNIELDSTFSILNNSETEFKSVKTKDNKSLTLTISTYSKLLKHKEDKVREQAYKNYLNGYLVHKETYSSLLYQHVKHLSTDAKIRKFDSLIDYCIFPDKISKSLLEKLFKNVQDNSKVLDKFKTAKKQFYKAKFNKDLKPWDNLVPLVKVKQNYSVKEAQDLVFKAISPLGKEYKQVIKQAFEQRWVDYYNVDNKVSGAYSIGGSYGVDKKYILMNFDFTFNSVSTLAHELGHSMHSYYSDKTMPYSLASYPIFLAEIASIFNELMLSDYVISNTKDDKVKFSLLDESISDFYQTVIKQTQWAEFEYELYKKVDQGIPINSYTEMEKLYVEVLNKYEKNPNKHKVNKPTNIYSVIVPHFYYGYYVYKYAIGYIVANVFFQKYKQEGKQALDLYIEKFLSAGGKDWPALILKEAGVDLEDESIYQQAFSVFNKNIKDYIKLGQKIFKIKQ
ncbi:oligoendopeptidase F [Mycoplasma sp. 1654_15]|uniref:oligoendopeptidase F n=1 Tax=Mycoplasma sp. 1654_15 TaxID=2725994 RepID=UPI001449D858|nr:oligoendopeptidase F [Mycoplasma sp. 1654_15]QJB71253.1 oligoendopeptidase F [Mycoplasma sp. 1654_15]